MNPSHQISSLPAYELRCRNGTDLWFTDNETMQSLYNQAPQSPYVKDAFHRYLLDGDQDAINPQQIRSKSAFHLEQLIDSGKSWTVDLRLQRSDREKPTERFGQRHFDQILEQRQTEWQEFLLLGGTETTR